MQCLNLFPRIPTLLVDLNPLIDIGKITPAHKSKELSQIYSELLRIASNVDSL